MVTFITVIIFVTVWFVKNFYYYCSRSDRGKVMSFVSPITMCAQPLGQTIYGLLFDKFSNTVYLILIPTGIIVCIIGLLAIDLFRQLEQEYEYLCYRKR